MVFPYMTHLLAAMLLGALIGAERQWRQRMAGLRTNATVATGAAVFILSAMSASPDSPGRIAAQIVPVSASLGQGDYARWHERPRPQYRRHAVVFGRDRRTLRHRTVLERDGGYADYSVRQYPAARGGAAHSCLAGAGDEEKRYVLRVTCLREHENAVRQLLLNIAQQQRFTLQGLQSAAADTADHLEICAQLISHKQHQKRWHKLWRRWAFSRTSHRCTGVSERRRGWRRSSGNGRSSRDSPSRGKRLEWPPRRRL